MKIYTEHEVRDVVLTGRREAWSRLWHALWIALLAVSIVGYLIYLNLPTTSGVREWRQAISEARRAQR